MLVAKIVFEEHRAKAESKSGDAIAWHEMHNSRSIVSQNAGDNPYSIEKM
jgi:hypothetical protein